MNRRFFILTCISVYLIVALLTGCASTKQIVPRATGPIDSNSARIVVSRGNDFSGAVVPIGIIDSGKQVGAIGPGGQIVWDRIVGPMQLVSFDTRWPSDITYIPPLQVCVGAGMIYQFRAYWPTFSNDRYPKIELVSGTPVVCEQNETKTIAAKTESAQQPSAKGEETKIFIGKVEKVTPLLGGWSAPYNKIVVTDDKGIQETFYVLRATVITDAGGKDISGSGTKRDKKVEIKYSIITNGSSITDGNYKADSIKYLD
ncbi:MAG: hypothetical protein ABSC11_10655 [Smithella sp.]|jgi:hypothetical protein